MVVGVSSDSVASHDKFAQANSLPFTLLADANGSLRKAFGVPKTLGMLPGRVTYVIDPEGRVRHIFNSQLGISKHIEESIRVIREMSA